MSKKSKKSKIPPGFTFANLYSTLLKEDDFLKFFDSIQDDSSRGFVIESFCILMARFGVLQRTMKMYAQFELSLGNFDQGKMFNQDTVQNMEQMNIRRGKDSADICLVNRENNKAVVISSKSTEKVLGARELELGNINSAANRYCQTEVIISTLTFDKKKTLKVLKSTQTTDTPDRFSSEFMVDLKDLDKMHKEFQRKFRGVSVKDAFRRRTDMMKDIFHQIYTVEKTLNLIKKQKQQKVLWGHIPRSGKSFMMLKYILRGVYKRPLYIMTNPTEAKKDMRKKIAKQQEFDGWDSLEIKEDTGRSNILTLASLQSLKTGLSQGKSYNLERYDIVFLDEMHKGGSTELTDLLRIQRLKVPLIFMSATYSKIVAHYNIPETNIIEFNQLDSKLLSNFEENRTQIDYRFGKDMVEKTLKTMKNKQKNNSLEQSISEFYKTEYPEICCMSWADDNGIGKEATDGYGWSIRSHLGFLEKGSRQEKGIITDKMRRIYGYEQGKKIVKEDECMFKYFRTDQIRKGSACATNTNRQVVITYISSRVGGTIDQTIDELIEMCKEMDFMKKYIILKDTARSPLGDIESYINAQDRPEAEYVLIFCGKKNREGFTEKKCHIIILMDDAKGYDINFQTLYRSATPDPDEKKVCYVFDCNLQRHLEMVISIGKKYTPYKTRRERYKFIESGENILNPEAFYWNGMSFSKMETERYRDILREELIRSPVSLDVILQEIATIRFPKELSSFAMGKISPTVIKKLIYSTDYVDIPTGIKKTRQEISDEEEITDEEENTDEPKETIQRAIILFQNLVPILSLINLDKKNSFRDAYQVICNDDEMNKFITQVLVRKINFKGDLCSIITMLDEHEDIVAELDTIYKDIQEQMEKFAGNRTEFSKMVDAIFVPTKLEKKNFAEVSTPHSLRQDMLDRIPEDVWCRQSKVLEPCCGKGGFVVDIVHRFLEVLGDDEETYRWVVENCIYFGDINPLNVRITRILLDPYNKGYKLNSYTGDTLQLDPVQEWGVDQFDLVVGNPPYQKVQVATGKRGGGDLLWNKFVVSSIQRLRAGGLLCFVHPSGWRKPDSHRSKFTGMFKLMTKENQMRVLSIHDTRDGLRVFGCGTRYDWYVLEKRPCDTTTVVIDEKRQEHILDLCKWPFLPNHGFDELLPLLSTTGIHSENVLHGFAYETRKPHVSQTQTNEFCYPLIHATNKTGVRYCYSSRNDQGHFGIPKVIFGETGINSVVIDRDGTYGMTQHAMAIPTTTDFDDIAAFLLSDRFQRILKACSWSNYMIDWRLFTHLKPQFWKY